jgi:hypothetical protein
MRRCLNNISDEEMSQHYFRWRGGHLNTVSDGAIYLELNEQQAKNI